MPRSALGELTVAARGLLFRRSKLSVWRDALRATETYVTPPLDEYEQPSEIPLLEVNRITANPLLLRDLPTLAARRHASLFAQLQRAKDTAPSNPQINMQPFEEPEGVVPDAVQDLQEGRQYKPAIYQTEEEKREEEEFRRVMLDKFAEDDRLDQMNAQKRRMKQLEHRKEIERLLGQKSTPER